MFPSLSAFGGILGFLGLAPQVKGEPQTLRDTILGTQGRPYQRHPDTYPFDYASLVRDPKTAGELPPLALKVNAGANPKSRVALVGGGIGNIIAAYELSRIGVQTTLFEESDRLGGRLYTVEMAKQPSELGGMRFPDRGLFWHYVGLWAQHRGYTLDGVDVNPFPNPGTVPTLLTYQGQTYDYNNLPAIFTEASSLFRAYLANLNDGAPLGKTVYFADVVQALTTSPDDQVSQQGIDSFWNAMLARYDSRSFGDVLQDEVFATGTNVPNLMAAFGTVGLGTGGFGPLYGIAMLDILRILLWQYQFEFALPSNADYDKLDAWGLQGFAQGMADLAFTERQKFDPNVTKDQMFQLNSKVTSVTVPGGQVALRIDGGPSYLFDYAIVAMTTRAMQRIGIDLNVPDGVFSKPDDGGVLESTQAAIRRCNLISAYKMFLTVPTPDKRSDWPTDATGKKVLTFLTDGIPRQAYVLPPVAGQAETSALVSYTWGADAIKYEQMTTAERQQMIATSYQYGAGGGTLSSAKFGDILAQATAGSEVVWNSAPGFGGGFKLDKPEDNYFTGSLFYHYQIAKSPDNPWNLGSKVFFAGCSVGNLGGWIEGAATSSINAVVAVCGEIAVKENSLTLRDAVKGLLNPSNRRFHKYLCIQGEEPQPAGLLEMHRLGQWGGNEATPPTWSFGGTVSQASAGFVSSAVSSDGNYAVVTDPWGDKIQVLQRGATGWIKLEVLSLSALALVCAIDSLPLVNGKTPELQMLYVDSAGKLWHALRNADGNWTPFANPPWGVNQRDSASACACTLDGPNLHVAMIDGQGILRYGIRFPTSWSDLGTPSGPNGGAFKVSAVAAGNEPTPTSDGTLTIAVADPSTNSVRVVRRIHNTGQWLAWDTLAAPPPPNANEPNSVGSVAVVVQSKGEFAQLVATFGNRVFNATRHAPTNNLVWTGWRQVFYPMGGTGRIVKRVAAARLEGSTIPPYSTSIFADSFPGQTATSPSDSDGVPSSAVTPTPESVK